MRIVHPDLPGQSAVVTELQFERLYEPRGWQEAPDHFPEDQLTRVAAPNTEEN